MDLIYLDHGATTPLDPEVAAGSQSASGRSSATRPSTPWVCTCAAARALEEARASLARSRARCGRTR
ncbi:MAG: hypothetical protein R3F43_05910 [bacterium]